MKKDFSKLLRLNNIRKCGDGAELEAISAPILGLELSESPLEKASSDITTPHVIETDASRELEALMQKKADAFQKSLELKSTTKKALPNILSGAFLAADNIALGDKNFGALSLAIDTVVHGASTALLKSGNPYAMAAGAALEGVNFMTKAGGLTVQGYDVDINSSGYGTLGHQDSSSYRSFFGLNAAKIDRQLNDRNLLAQNAIKALQINDETKFEQEARMSTIDDTVYRNQVALSGGLDTSLLGA